MSNDISYVIRVVDEFSAPLKKFQTGMGHANQVAAKSAQSFNQAQTSTKFFTQNLIDLGKAAGIYASVGGALSFGKSVFDTRVQMDSLNASLTAIMPKFNQTKPAAQLAADEIEYLKSVTERFGISFQKALPNYMQFLASSKQDLATTRKTFESFTSISRLYGLSAERFGLVITALNQMQSKGVISMEELRQQLGESLPGALDLFAESAGMSTAKFIELVGKGKIGAGLLKKVAETIEQKYGKDVVAASKTLGAETERLSNAWFGLKDVLSKGVAPALTSTVVGMTDGVRTTQSFVAAIGNPNLPGATPGIKLLANAFYGVGQTLKFAAEQGERLAKIISPLGKVITAVGYGIKDAGVLGRIGFEGASGVLQTTRGALYGGDFGFGGQDIEEGGAKMGVAHEAFSELFNQIATRNAQPQKVEVQITHANTPKGTDVQVKKSASPNLKVGNIVNYDMQEAY